MATILRSSRYVRCLNAFARRIVIGRDNENFATKSLALQTQCINSYLTKSYATAVPAVQRNDTAVNYDKYLAKLDDYVQRYGRVYKQDVEEVLSKIRNSGYIPSLDGLLLIRCCGDLLVDTTPAVRNQLAQDIWNTLENLKIPMDASHFNALLRVYLENNYEFSPIELLTKMKEQRIEPNRVTYQRLIMYYCKKGDIDGATKILEFMREKGLPLNESVFNALITGHSEANDMESATNILNVMKEAGVVPCSSTYTALLVAHAKRGDMDSIKRVIDECSSKELYLHDKELFEVVQELAAHGHDDKIKEILSLMPKGPNYNYDAFHAIQKILDVGNVNVAMTILPTMRKRIRVDDEAEENENGTFLIRKLVSSNFPAETVIQACEQLEQQGQHARAFFVALERSLMNSDTVLSIPLLKAWKKRGGTIREHYVWPLLVSYGKASNYQGIQDVLTVLVSEFNITPGVETITDFVLPYTLGKWNDVVATLKEYRIPQKTIITAIAVRMLMDNKIRKTSMFMSDYPLEYDESTFYRPLASALSNTDDARSAAVILRFLHHSSASRAANDLIENEAIEESTEHHKTENVIDTAMQKILKILPTRKRVVLDELFDQLIENGMSLSPEMGQSLREYFKDYIMPETIEKIDKLTSGTLELVPISNFVTRTSTDDSSEISGGSQESTSNLGRQFSVKRQQLSSCILSRDSKGVQALIEELESLNFKFSPAICAQIIDFFCMEKNVEEAEKWINKCKLENPGIVLDLQKSTNYAALLVKNGRFDDALQFILESPRKMNPNTHGPGLRRLVKNLLDVAAETGNAEKTNALFDALLSSNYCLIDSYMLGSLIKVHLNKDDLEGALNEFAKICQKYRCTPMKNELSKKFIDTEDANSLQRLTDLSTQIHGESNSLVDLVLSFIECGRLRQARKILETPGLRLRNAKLKNASKRYIEDGKPEYLDQLFEITKGLPILDRQELYDVLLDTYSQVNNWQRGLSLWTEMQDEDTQASPKFLNTLAELLRRNKQPVPFIHSNEKETAAIVDIPDFVRDFNAAIEMGNLDRAEKIIKNSPETHTEFSSMMSRLIDEILAQQNDVDKANELTQLLVTKFTRQPRANTLKSVWNALINAGKYEELKSYQSILSEGTKKRYRFYKYLSRVNLAQRGVKQFLDDFQAQLKETRKHNFALVKENIHFRALLRGFKKEPSAVMTFKPIAEMLSEQQIKLPINILWSYYFEQNSPEADEIWSKHLSNSNVVLFKYLLDEGKNTGNVELIERLHNTVANSTAITDNAKSFILASLVEVYSQVGRRDDAVKVLQGESAKIIKSLQETKPQVVKELEKGLNANGKSLPFNVIPIISPS